MSAFLKKYWPVALIVVVLLSVGGWALLHEPAAAPPLSPAGQKAVERGIERDQKQVGSDTTRATAAATSGATSYQAGKAYAELGKVLHQQSKSHAKPTISSDTAARRLQRQLANY